MIVLNEATQPADPIDEAIASLLEAALAHSENVTPAELAQAVLEGAQVLAEAGGLISWVKRVYSGKDDSASGEIEKESKGKLTAAKKKELLAHVEKLIDEAEKEIGKGEDGQSKGLMMRMGRTLLGGWPSLLLRAMNRSNGGIAAYLSSLRAVKTKLQAAPTEG
jgi:hypothetical protein